VPVEDVAARIAREHQPVLFAYAMRLCGHPNDARDLVQDTFERALRFLASGRPIDNERAWLLSILHNAFADSRRRRARRPEQPLDDAPEPAHPEPEALPGWARITRADLEAAVAQLDEEFRVVYRRHALEGRSYGELAAELGIPVNTVGTRLVRARRKLRDILKAKAEDA
jgi:RNA polymerase sigma-70 factor (ECF subfamily)